MTDQDDILEKPGTWMGDSSDKEDTENHDEDRHEEQTHWRWRNLDKIKWRKMLKTVDTKQQINLTDENKNLRNIA